MHLHLPSKSLGLTYFQKMPRLLFPLLAQEIEHPCGPVHHSSPQTVRTKVGHRVGADSINQEHGLSFVLHVTKPSFHCCLPVAHRWSFPYHALIKIAVPTVCFAQGLCVCARAHIQILTHFIYVCVCIVHLHIYIYISHAQIFTFTQTGIFTYIHIHVHTFTYSLVHKCMYRQTHSYINKFINISIHIYTLRERSL